MKPSPDVSAILDSITHTYYQAKSVLDDKLGAKGYRIIAEKYNPEVFGSRWAVWSNDKDAIRFIWDGRNNLFYLQALDKPPVDYRDTWRDLIEVPYDPRKHDQGFANGIPGELISSLGFGE